MTPRSQPNEVTVHPVRQHPSSEERYKSSNKVQVPEGVIAFIHPLDIVWATAMPRTVGGACDTAINKKDSCPLGVHLGVRRGRGVLTCKQNIAKQMLEVMDAMREKKVEKEG